MRSYLYIRPSRIDRKALEWRPFSGNARVGTTINVHINTVSREESGTSDRAAEMPKTTYYAVKVGAKPGIYMTWLEAEKQIKGFTGAKFKKFPTEAEAKAFINDSLKTPYSAPTNRQSTSHPTASKNGTVSEPARLKNSRSPEIPDTDVKDLPDNLKEIAKKGYTFADKKFLVVYTDGSGLGNGKEGARAGCGVFWGGEGEAVKKNLAERVPGLNQTNNRGEILAVIRALETCPYPEIPLLIRTDSKYTISCMMEYMPGWMQNGFKTAGKKKDVKNVEMLKHLLVLLRKRGPTAQVKFKYIEAHAGHPGNEAADGLAKMGARSPELPEKTDWLDPDTYDFSISDSVPVDIGIEIDESWLLSTEEMDELEKDL